MVGGNVARVAKENPLLPVTVYTSHLEESMELLWSSWRKLCLNYELIGSARRCIVVGKSVSMGAQGPLSTSGCRMK